METISHTKGPWRTGDMFNTVFGPPNGNPSPEVVATINKGRRANARLIAAAPEMLEALLDYEELLVNSFEGDPDIEKVRALIARAKGE